MAVCGVCVLVHNTPVPPFHGIVRLCAADRGWESPLLFSPCSSFSLFFGGGDQVFEGVEWVGCVANAAAEARRSLNTTHATQHTHCCICRPPAVMDANAQKKQLI